MKAKDPIRGKAATKPGSLLRNSITIRKASDEVEAEPGFFEVDTVAHCGPTLQGEFCRSVNFTDIHTGWVFTRSIRNNAHIPILSTFNTFITHIPYMVTGIDCDNGSEFINHHLIDWATHQKVFFTRSRPYKKNDQTTIESKNNHLLRRYGFYHRYDTPAELDLLNQLWPLVCDRLNFLTPTKKPIGWTTDTIGRRKRIYDQPRTPYQRLLDANNLNPTQQTELATYKANLKPTTTAHEIARIQHELIRLATTKTRQPEQQTHPKLPPPQPAASDNTPANPRHPGKTIRGTTPTSRGLDNEAPRSLPECWTSYLRVSCVSGARYCSAHAESTRGTPAVIRRSRHVPA